jgi:hypothetical protein
MQSKLDVLSDQEKELLLDAIPMITILIGGADGILDDKEQEWAEKITIYRSHTNTSDLRAYYEEVSLRLRDRIEDLLKALPAEAKERNVNLSKIMSGLNPILKKLESGFSYTLYHDFLSFARHVAKATGGVFRMASISPIEQSYIDLKMLDPVSDGAI